MELIRTIVPEIENQLDGCQMNAASKVIEAGANWHDQIRNALQLGCQVKMINKKSIAFQSWIQCSIIFLGYFW